MSGWLEQSRHPGGKNHALLGTRNEGTQPFLRNDHQKRPEGQKGGPCDRRGSPEVWSLHRLFWREQSREKSDEHKENDDPGRREDNRTDTPRDSPSNHRICQPHLVQANQDQNHGRQGEERYSASKDYTRKQAFVRPWACVNNIDRGQPHRDEPSGHGSNQEHEAHEARQEKPSSVRVPGRHLVLLWGIGWKSPTIRPNFVPAPVNMSSR